MSSASLSAERLRWQCRRGMLELDYVLQAYLDAHFLSVSPVEQEQFVRLLQCQDTELQAWLLQGEPPDPEFDLIVNQLRNPAG